MPVLTHTALFVDSNTPKVRIDDFNDKIQDKEHYKELYSFKDKKGRNLSLRGDITPQFMNLLTSYYSNKKLQSQNIYKWYTIADCWRYERPGLGRRRNHQQWNADIVGKPFTSQVLLGISDIQVEVELISMLIHFFKSVGLSYEDVVISLNHRNTIPGILALLGFSNYSTDWIYQFSKTLDKCKKIPKDEFNELLLDLKFTPDQCSELDKIIENSKTVEELEGIFNPEDIRELKQLVDLLAEKGYSNWINIDLTIVRGNDYYTGLVFECFDRNQMHSRSIAGGGRYDNYFNNCDPRLTYSAGFGMGNIAIMDLIKQKGLNVKSEQLIDVLVFTPNSTSNNCEQKLETDSDQSLLCSKNQRMCLYNLMDLLRSNDLVKALKFGDNCMAKFVLMPLLRDGNEFIVLRDMKTGLQVKKYP
ncbi:histidyl-trna synthetase, putative [Theileria annulata]|uniref:histidine--tRNA ligase n=1 Tax=Theileria annulata TaxID=5874 RepID=Q4UED8_THEAN|nr:histidyl-trna synthetase, putative [Theileria annulata]CAI74551.1 histidyl-trna synthetase, putative [Theileria annulata]|eukprot:XP_952283.1 histidyl-trna synthetase, putative [Theileria annulata]